METPVVTVKSLRERAMLGYLRISVWEGRRYDPILTREVHERHGAANDSGSYNRHLFGKGAMSAITSARTRARTWFNKHTLAWDDDSWRLLPATMHGEISEKMRSFESEFDSAVRDWLDRYPQIVEEQRQRQNGMFDQRMYPPVHVVARRFRLEVRYQPLADADDFRVRLADTQTRALVEAIQRSTEERLQRALRDTWQRLYVPVAEMVGKLREFDHPEKEKRRQWVTDSIVSNIQAILDILPSLNVLGDPELARMADRVRDQLTGLDHKVLTRAPDVRAATIQTAEAILADMTGFVGEPE